ncbi:MAG: LysM peptidoglycan-binding domain-containing protein [Crocinitomicaceae bacterium]
MKQLILGVLFLCITLTGVSQTEVETINGKKYLVHIVEKKQTLYGIHRKFNVSVEDISKANTGIDNGLKVGQKLLIPISYDNKDYYENHVISKGETLYSLSKKYQCSVVDLKTINPELSDLDVQIGQVIVVPKLGLSKTDKNVDRVIEDDVEVLDFEPIKVRKALKEDTVVNHTVLAHETLYSIAKRYMVTPDEIRKLNDLSINSLKPGDVLVVPVKKVNYKVFQNNIDSNFIYNPVKTSKEAIIVRKPSYKIVLLVPLMYDANKTAMNRPIKIGELEKLNPVTELSSDFYHGFKMAADSLAKAGFNAEIFIYDTKKDTNTIKSIFNKNDFSDVDMVVGPFFQNTVNYVAKFCRDKEIPMILPVNSNNSVLYNNPYVYKTTASAMSQIDGMVDFLVNDYSSYNICIVKPNSENDKALYNRARDRYNGSTKSGAYSTNIVEIDLGSSSGREWNLKLRKDTVNVIIVPSKDVKFVTSVFTRVNNVLNTNVYAKGMKVIVFGLEDWNQIDDIDVKHRMRSEQHYSSYKFLNYSDLETIQFVNKFRMLYGNEPRSPAFQGFDVGYYFMSALYLYGQNYNYFLSKHQVDLIQNNFKFTSVSAQDGYENTTKCIVKYQDYNLVFISW